jgi:hypothetical protein
MDKVRVRPASGTKESDRKLEAEVAKLKTSLINAEIEVKQARTLVEKKNLEVGALCDQIVNLKSVHKKEMDQMRHESMEISRKVGADEAKID